MTTARRLTDWLGRLAGLLPDPLPDDPVPLLNDWMTEATAAAATPNPNAMVLSTVRDGAPAGRVVLCKSIDLERGALVFFTNGQSPKGREIERAPRVAATFHWDHAGRQARVEGEAGPVDASESDAYFASRPLLSRLGAWASEQSEPLERRGDLVRSLAAVMRRFDVGVTDLAAERSGVVIPRPPHWGGYRIVATKLELWVSVRGRLHDRACWARDAPDRPWSGTRLQP